MVTSVVAVENGPIPRSTTATVSMARGQDRAGLQRLGFPPSCAGEQRWEGKVNDYNGIGQVEHGWDLPSNVRPGQLALSARRYGNAR